VGTSQVEPRLCSLTSSAMSTILGEPEMSWIVFDYITKETINLPYAARLKKLTDYFDENSVSLIEFRVSVIPSFIINNMEQLLSYENHCLTQGYEGLILRDIDGKYKQGRATAREGSLLRIKRFLETDAKILEVVEGTTNENEQLTNELGKSYRQSLSENLTPNGQVGSFSCEVLEDCIDPVTKVKVLSAGSIVTVGAGSMPHTDREYYWTHRNSIIGNVIKFKHFPIGIKDKPRFPTFQGFRAKADTL